MKLTLEEARILQDLAESATNQFPRGKKAANYEQTREQRLAQYRQVGDLINRYELWLASQN